MLADGDVLKWVDGRRASDEVCSGLVGRVFATWRILNGWGSILYACRVRPVRGWFGSSNCALKGSQKRSVRQLSSQLQDSYCSVRSFPEVGAPSSMEVWVTLADWSLIAKCNAKKCAQRNA